MGQGGHADQPSGSTTSYLAIFSHKSKGINYNLIPATSRRFTTTINHFTQLNVDLSKKPQKIRYLFVFCRHLLSAAFKKDAHFKIYQLMFIVKDTEGITNTTA